MRHICPHCAEVLSQENDPVGLNYCANCHRIILVPPAKPVPTWGLVLLLVLMAVLLVLVLWP